MPRVLLVDTEPHLTAALRRKFEAEGFSVSIQDGSEENCNPITPVTPDLIVVGKVPAGSNAVAGTVSEALDLVNIHKDAATVPIILITPGTEASELTPNIPHLSMPFRPSQLMEMAHKAIAPI